jgi:hypothetical protein
MPDFSARDFEERAFTIGIGGSVLVPIFPSCVSRLLKRVYILLIDCFLFERE